MRLVTFSVLNSSTHWRLCMGTPTAARLWFDAATTGSVSCGLQNEGAEELGATFALEHEDHTLANALRFFLNKKCAQAENHLRFASPAHT